MAFLLSTRLDIKYYNISAIGMLFTSITLVKESYFCGYCLLGRRSHYATVLYLGP